MLNSASEQVFCRFAVRPVLPRADGSRAIRDHFVIMISGRVRRCAGLPRTRATVLPGRSAGEEGDRSGSAGLTQPVLKSAEPVSSVAVTRNGPARILNIGTGRSAVLMDW